MDLIIPPRIQVGAGCACAALPARRQLLHHCGADAQLLAAICAVSLLKAHLFACPLIQAHTNGRIPRTVHVDHQRPRGGEIWLYCRVWWLMDHSTQAAGQLEAC